MRALRSTCLLLALLGPWLHPAGAAAESFAVVTSAENPTREAGPRALRRLYLKEQAEWPSGGSAKPYGRPATSEAHKAFLEHVLDMGQTRLAEHWISLKQRTGQRRVREVTSDQQLKLLLHRFPGAFGVLPLSVAERDPRLAIVHRFP